MTEKKFKRTEQGIAQCSWKYIQTAGLRLPLGGGKKWGGSERGIEMLLRERQRVKLRLCRDLIITSNNGVESVKVSKRVAGIFRLEFRKAILVL